MDVKIQPAIGGTGSIETESKTGDVTTAAATEASSTAAADPVGRIAGDIASGRITVEQGVDLMIDQVLSADMVAAAPQSVRSEIAQMLRVALDTDPTLIAMMNRLRQ